MKVGQASAFQKTKGILVCCIATYRGREVPQGVHVLLKSCFRFGIQPRLFGVDKRWRSMYETKFVHLHDCINACKNEYEYVFALDASDTVWLRPLEETYEIAQRHGLMTFCTERNCWPDSNLAHQYPRCSTSYRFLNAGGFFGKMSTVLSTFAAVRDAVQDHRNDDQLAWSLGYLRGFPIGLDHECKVFQSLWGHKDDEFTEDGVNKETGTQPCILHANGSHNFHAVYRRYV